MPVSKRAATGKLPAESTSFVGRRRLLAEVKAALTGTVTATISVQLMVLGTAKLTESRSAIFAYGQ